MLDQCAGECQKKSYIELQSMDSYIEAQYRTILEIHPHTSKYFLNSFEINVQADFEKSSVLSLRYALIH